MMPALRARSDDLCELCGQPIDFDAPARSSRAPSVDHVVPLHAGGQALPPLEELRLVHVGCNAKRGNHTRRMAPAIVPTAAAVELRDPIAPRARQYQPPRRSNVDHSLDDHPSLFDELQLVELERPRHAPAGDSFKSAATVCRSTPVFTEILETLARRPLSWFFAAA